MCNVTEPPPRYAKNHKPDIRLGSTPDERDLRKNGFIIEGVGKDLGVNAPLLVERDNPWDGAPNGHYLRAD